VILNCVQNDHRSNIINLSYQYAGRQRYDRKGAVKTKTCLKRFEGLKTKFYGEEIKGTARLAGDAKSWTRNRSMTLANILMCATGRKALTGLMEIRQFFKTIDGAAVSKQDYFARRQHLNYEAFELLNREYLQDFYTGEEPYRWNEFIVLAIGSAEVTGTGFAWRAFPRNHAIYRVLPPLPAP
jgi:hypothetical protein